MKTPATTLSLSIALALAAPLAHGAVDIEQRLAELEAELAEMKADSADNVRRNPAGGFVVGNTTLRFSGYMKGDVSVSDRGYQGGKAWEVVTAAGVKSTDKDLGYRTTLSARQSQFAFSTSTPVGENTFRTFVSVDFYGEDTKANELVSNSYAPRLREAYGSYGKLLVGQTWSTFTDLMGVGELVGFGQHASVNFVRQAQVRYTQPFDGGKLELAMENPEDTGAGNQDVPDLIARLSFNGNWGYVSAAAAVRRMALDNATGRDYQWTDAYSLTARIPTVGKDDIRLQVNYGNVGRYMGLRSFPDAVVEQGGTSIHGVDAWGYSAIYRHFWTEKLRSSLAWSDSAIRERGRYAATANARYSTASLNLLYSPIRPLTYGIELQRYDLEEVGGTKHELNRVQFSAWYHF